MKAAQKSKSATAPFLLEIGAEEIPAGMIARAAEELKTILEKYLNSLALADGGSVETFGAPRRLVAMCNAVRLQQADVVREVSGPPKAVAFDAEGKPTRAAESFAAKQGASLRDLYLTATPKGEYVAVRQTIRGRAARDLLADVLPRAIQEIPWPKNMYWGAADGPRFIRPVRWVVALLGREPVKFQFGDVMSGRDSAGHRMFGAARIPIPDPAAYESLLQRNSVVPRPAKRRQRITQEIQDLLKSHGLRLRPDADLLEQVTYLNEFPGALLGDFDPAFLALPEEVLITVMRGHQKYFAVEGRSGKLAPHFVAVLNRANDAGGVIRAGHERVLRARFADARFFWEHDLKSRLADNREQLQRVTYESRLGSYAAKAARMRELATWLAVQWNEAGIGEVVPMHAGRAADLAKCDLVTSMVREFTELQGVVGGLYAREQHEADDIAWAIYDHYRPVGLDDPVPRNLTGCAVALADKFDALAGCFTVGLAPTGSSDPFALRRAALGVVKIILERELPVSLGKTLATAAGILAVNPPRIDVSGQTRAQLLEFLADRARYVFRERMGFAYDEVNAALAAGSDDLVDAHKRLVALKAIRNTRNFEPLATAFKRIRKILEKSAEAKATPTVSLAGVREDLFAEDAERELYRAAVRVAQQAGGHRAAGKYREALLEIAALRPPVDRFFDEVLVMAEDESVRRNRQALLGGLLREFSTIADFSEIVTEEKR